LRIVKPRKSRPFFEERLTDMVSCPFDFRFGGEACPKTLFIQNLQREFFSVVGGVIWRI